MNAPRAGSNWFEVEDLNVFFGHGSREVHAVRDVSFALERGEVVGLVGESGSGKSATGLSILQLHPSSRAKVTGRVSVDGKDIQDLGRAEMQQVRGNEISMIFQDALSALDPVYTVGKQLVDTLRAHNDLKRAAAREIAVDLLASVGIPEPRKRFDNYPHQLSGGMRQRVMIAIALACEPKVLIADEPTTALDVTIQAQVLDLLRELAAAHDTAILFISHDLGVIAELCSRVLTMYAGEIVEQSSIDDMLEKPFHPYTSGLIQALPANNAGSVGDPLVSIPGRVPPLTDLPEGCFFNPRCAHRTSECVGEHPPLRHVQSTRATRCIRSELLELPGTLLGLDDSDTRGASR
ncbi:ABC transporter ATP-binding protein [Cumulibacter soli]|uniref:ABC transporter ATP-binding protein n=1 Tax=Cumulibacter soli TaxID=2546344 RepID=UPI001067B8E0|nr:ABC transporter ATP-binding protein [Cumulibacter soli]